MDQTQARFNNRRSGVSRRQSRGSGDIILILIILIISKNRTEVKKPTSYPPQPLCHIISHVIFQHPRRDCLPPCLQTRFEAKAASTSQSSLQRDHSGIDRNAIARAVAHNGRCGIQMRETPSAQRQLLGVKSVKRTSLAWAEVSNSITNFIMRWRVA